MTKLHNRRYPAALGAALLVGALIAPLAFGGLADAASTPTRAEHRAAVRVLFAGLAAPLEACIAGKAAVVSDNNDLAQGSGDATALQRDTQEMQGGCQGVHALVDLARLPQVLRQDAVIGRFLPDALQLAGAAPDAAGDAADTLRDDLNDVLDDDGSLTDALQPVLDSLTALDNALADAAANADSGSGDSGATATGTPTPPPSGDGSSTPPPPNTTGATAATSGPPVQQLLSSAGATMDNCVQAKVALAAQLRSLAAGGGNGGDLLIAAHHTATACMQATQALMGVEVSNTIASSPHVRRLALDLVVEATAWSRLGGGVQMCLEGHGPCQLASLLRTTTLLIKTANADAGAQYIQIAKNNA